MKKSYLLLIVIIPLYSLAQDAVVRNLETESLRSSKTIVTDTSKRSWKTGGIYNINVSQGSLSNWAAGGDNFALTVNSLLSLYACYKKKKCSWDNSFDFDLGYVNTTSLGSRKNDDRFDLLSKFGYRVGKKTNVAGLFDFRSQIFKGYTYNGEIKTISSAFLAPGYVTTSIGLDWHPVKELSIFLSPATSRWTMVKYNRPSIKALYSVDSSTQVHHEMGAFATINYLHTVNKIINYKLRLDLLSNYKHDPQNVDVYMTNLVTVKLSRFLSLTWNLDIIYDDDVKLFGEDHDSPALQLRSLAGAGLLVKM